MAQGQQHRATWLATWPPASLPLLHRCTVSPSTLPLCTAAHPSTAACRPQVKATAGGEPEVPLPSELSQLVAKALARRELQADSTWCSIAFREAVTHFLKEQVRRVGGLGVCRAVGCLSWECCGWWCSGCCHVQDGTR